MTACNSASVQCDASASSGRGESLERASRITVGRALYHALSNTMEQNMHRTLNTLTTLPAVNQRLLARATETESQPLSEPICCTDLLVRCTRNTDTSNQRAQPTTLRPPQSSVGIQSTPLANLLCASQACTLLISAPLLHSFSHQLPLLLRIIRLS